MGTSTREIDTVPNLINEPSSCNTTTRAVSRPTPAIFLRSLSYSIFLSATVPKPRTTQTVRRLEKVRFFSTDTMRPHYSLFPGKCKETFYTGNCRRNAAPTCRLPIPEVVRRFGEPPLRLRRQALTERLPYCNRKPTKSVHGRNRVRFAVPIYLFFSCTTRVIISTQPSGVRRPESKDRS